MKTVTAIIVAVMLPLALTLVSCSKGDSPEKQVKLFVAAAEKAVETRSIWDVKELISEHYSDDGGRTRQEIVAVTARYMYANRNIHLFTRIKDLTFPSPDRARLKIYVAMTGSDVTDPNTLLNMRGDLYRFDVELAREDGEWKLLRAEWQRARGEDFL